MRQLIAKVLEVRGTCPQCGGNIYAWRNKGPNGEDRCAPVCMNCGYAALNLRADVRTNEIYQKKIRDRYLAMFKSGSVVTNRHLFDKNLKNYNVTNQEQQKATDLAERFVQSLLKGERKHLVLTGTSGVGKSHLSMGICWEYLERSGYQKHVLFVNYRELLESLKLAMLDESARKAIQKNLINDLKSCDLLVLDDLGAELGGVDVKKDATTRFNNETLYGILEARQEESLIVNTNLSSAEIEKFYGNRILSRIVNNSSGFFMKFENTKDNRKMM